MIYSITGILRVKDVEFCTLDQFGLEWELQVSGNTLRSLPPVGKKIRLLTYLHHKEDSMRLFGFISQNEKRTFLELLKVSGVGPKGAMKILSGISPEEFLQALETDDLPKLGTLPGVGKKTAQKIMLQLKGKLLEPEENLPAVNSWTQEITTSLMAMGFDKKLVKKVVSEIALKEQWQKMSSSEREQEVMRQAIIALSR